MRPITRWRPQPTTGRATATRVGSLRPPALAALDISDVEWHALMARRPNLLLEGKLVVTDHILRALRPHLLEPIWCWRTTTALSLPRVHGGSLLLFGVTTMPAREQSRLHEWLTDNPERVQIVSMATQPLFTLVERGMFRADLYYRLSVFRIAVTPDSQDLEV
jgi:hypothetical protein